MEPAVQFTGVTRVFGAGASRVDVLTNASFTVASGEVVALLGHNGAGKTTLIKILGTLLLPTSGHASVHGADVVADARACRRTTGMILGGDRGFYPRLSAVENLRYFGALAGVGYRELRRRVPDLLDEFGLTEASSRPVSTFSKGMRQRLHLAAGLIHRPRVLLLDEPTVGLDPIEAERLRSRIASLADDGVAVLLTSHDLTDVAALADRILALQNGSVSEPIELSEFMERAGYVGVIECRGAIAELPQPFPSVVVATKELSPDSMSGRLDLQVRQWSTDAFEWLRRAADTPGVVIRIRDANLNDSYNAVFGAGGN